MKKRLPTILAIILMISGFALLAYPTASSWWNGRVQTRIGRIYYMDVARLAREQIDEQFRRAEAFNAILSEKGTAAPLLLGDWAILPDDYTQILNINGVMARLQIPAINVDLPIFHGTSPEVMEKGVGHLEGTAFPTGGCGTHSVLTTHSGMAHARLFSDLETLTIGDTFFITVLDRRLKYQVDRITVILPYEIEALRVIPGADMVTLITCTPLAVNTHRLLVRGTRIQYEPETIIETSLTVISSNMNLCATLISSNISLQNVALAATMALLMLKLLKTHDTAHALIIANEISSTGNPQT